ncbi:hypothetical protein NA56DRAFT_754725 [Hyaloscypha hepaticicola]|uniref:Uncharacterized protein n=1 Tax=Hyaloscypha hepaticicola TaxID=2082293 RepID=A0A2J6PKI3_9HELO|nr:hypothetical protein NA56DRAFT_754725 [Hyaloscypha hepaticicola]
MEVAAEGGRQELIIVYESGDEKDFALLKGLRVSEKEEIIEEEKSHVMVRRGKKRKRVTIWKSLRILGYCVETKGGFRLFSLERIAGEANNAPSKRKAIRGDRTYGSQMKTMQQIRFLTVIYGNIQRIQGWARVLVRSILSTGALAMLREKVLAIDFGTTSGCQNL